MRAIRYMLEKQRKLSAALFGSVALAAGAWMPADRYGAFSLAVAGLWGAVIAGHAYQSRNEKPEERSQPQP